MRFSFTMSFYEFCEANCIEKYSKQPSVERPYGAPNVDSMRLWRSACAERHKFLCDSSPFDPMIETSGGWTRVSQKYDRGSPVGANHGE